MTENQKSTDDTGNRALASIVFTDVVNYSERMSKDEYGTLVLVSKDLALMTDLTKKHQGRVIKSTGDGLMIYFDSAVKAVAWAIEFQSNRVQPGEGPGDFNTVHGITLDNEGKVYVADRANNRIQVFEGNGKYLTQWQSEKIGRPWSVAIGPDGYIYVADGGDVKEKPPERNGAVKLDLNGQVIARWGSFGSYDGQFYWAHDIGVDKDGAVYVVDVHHGMRVQKFVRSR